MRSEFQNQLSLSIEKDKIKSLRDIALETIRDAIITGALKPGQHLKERDLSEKMGISTTPIKEAIRVLSYEGLVESIPRKGNFVSELADTLISDIMYFRAQLEGYAVRLATDRMSQEDINDLEQYIAEAEFVLKNKDRDKTEKITELNNKFHMKLRVSTNNQLILNMIMNIVSFDKSFRKRALSYEEELERGVKEHKAIVKAIKDGNSTEAEEKMRNHIERTAKDVLSKLEV